ncbi:protein-disulfide oxidoreductase DsbI [Campylobacter suis]|uniref:Putative protein-disulfide oxidoreductase DsbI n=1 Tax=Campylobacter suis TaxID=2790657 RepID=A0ABM8Q923_9BACT|nr:protein-disulfide oxidoreductase DsbI [Campylobacter suis]CAD7289484.1 Protein-disulfide oxidoreductase DsbI [Campylobacter suis]
MGFIDKIAKWQDSRFPWVLMVIASISLVLIAHSVFQKYLYMPPCEQCVYIRVAFLIMAIGGIIAIINPRNLVLKLLGYGFGFWGAIYGMMCSIKLAKIHAAIHGDDADPFGVQGCSTEPSHILGLPLEKWAPDWFMPLGDCGKEDAIVPDGVILSSIQEYFINLYTEAGGWYLIPSKHFLSMADCTLMGFGLCFVILAVMLVSFILSKLRQAN